MALLNETEARSKYGDPPPSKTKFWRLIKKGVIPKPIKIGHRCAWIDSEIDASIQRLMAKRDEDLAAASEKKAPAAAGRRRQAAQARAEREAEKLAAVQTAEGQASA